MKPLFHPETIIDPWHLFLLDEDDDYWLARAFGGDGSGFYEADVTYVVLRSQGWEANKKYKLPGNWHLT